MYNLLKCEFLKLKSSKLFKYTLLSLIIVSSLSTTCEIIGLERYRTPETTDMYLSGIYTFASKFMFPDIIVILGGIFTIAFICHDFEERIIQSEICSGCSKFKILLSKVITCYIVVAFFVLINAVMGTVVVTIVYRVPGSVSLDLLFRILILYCISTLLTCGIISIAIMAAYLFKSTAISCMSFFAIMLIYIYLPRVIQDVKNIDDSMRIFTLPELCEKLYLELTSSFICNSIFQSLLYIVVFFFITYEIFKRSELK